MKITIKEVAQKAGVSPSTVSRVLSDSPQISEQTKKNVRKIIEELNYKPSAIARSLANKQNRIIGVILPKEAEDLTSNAFFLNALNGISNYAKEKNYYITYVSSNNKKEQEEYIKDFINSNLIAGICLLRVEEHDSAIEYLKKCGFPFAVIGRPENTEGILWVDNDNFKAAYELVDILVKKGKSSIMYIGAKEELTVTKDRLKGYKMACELNGININDKSIIIKNDFTEPEGYKAAEELFSKNKIVNGIIVQDDIMAFGVLKFLKNHNIKNVSVIGFNNSQFDEYQDPPLASVEIKPKELGYYAAKILIEAIEGSDAEIKHHIVNTELIVRKSML